ncbi:GSCFA domain-containing protein [Methylocystis sp.]|uniref:GSCFA domain-containing protein n=1 Tax=Methylocystis sp. TaxID=1911079 RepID=UPI0025D3EB79|nr:GSCFA domain-containing protein [Methylocystis sp.]
MKTHPYSKRPDYALWRRAVADVAPGELDPVVEAPFRFGGREKIATAGSCFAQHIGRYLKSSGCNYLVTEPPHSFISPQAADALNYGLYTARYGNIYTSRQLLQLFERAYGRFTPKENHWPERAGQVIDPFRPQIQPGGFNSVRELDYDRERHFAAVCKAFETLDVLVFTLGLTELWRSREDGAAFPLCPGVAGGDYSPARHEFVNLGVDEVVADMTAFLRNLRAVNPAARVILTVSPVPLVATAESRHVVTSTMYSKSALRVACDMLSRSLSQVAYFPSYEIVAGGYAPTDYFAPDRRSVTQQGVAHVMRVFERHYIKRSAAGEALRGVLRALGPVRSAPAEDPVAAAMRLMCDEEALSLERIEAASRDEAPSEAEPAPVNESGEEPAAQEPLVDKPEHEADPADPVNEQLID